MIDNILSLCALSQHKHKFKYKLSGIRSRLIPQGLWHNVLNWLRRKTHPCFSILHAQQ